MLWFDLCGWKLTEDQDNDTYSSDEITTLLVTGHLFNKNKTGTTSHDIAACSESPPQLIP